MQLMILLNLSSTFVSYMSELAHTTVVKVTVCNPATMQSRLYKYHNDAR